MSVQEIKLKEIADAIRELKGTTGPIKATDFADEIRDPEEKVYIIPKPEGNYYVALAIGELGEDKDSSNVTILYGNSVTMSGISGSAARSIVRCYNDIGLTDRRDIYKEEIIGFWFGSLYDQTTIGSHFLYGAIKYNQPLEIPRKIVSIGNSFLSTCRKFNQPITFGNRDITIGTDFLSTCGMFNQKLDITLNVFPNNFMYNCMVFNKPINLDGVGTSNVTIGNYFLYGCRNFNHDLGMHERIVSIGTYFLHNCIKFNYPIRIPTVSSFTGIPQYFMYNCLVFNQPTVIQFNITSISTNCFVFSYKFNQEFVIPSSVTSIGSNSMYGWSSFNKPITVPTSIASIGTNFFYNNVKFVSKLTWEASAYPSGATALSTTDGNADMYTARVPVVGAYASGLKTALPNNTTSPFRNLI